MTTIINLPSSQLTSMGNAAKKTEHTMHTSAEREKGEPAKNDELWNWKVVDQNRMHKK